MADEDPAPPEDWQVQLDAHKLQGDAAFRSADFSGAIRHYTAALSLDPTHATLLSNRSAAYLRNKEKSKALHDAQAIGDRMGIKGYSRLAAALQSLGRWQPALEQWEKILQEKADHPAALEGKKVCDAALKKEQGEKAKEEEEDELDDFFNEMEDVAAATKKEQLQAGEPKATDAILNHKKDLGTAEQQLKRLLADKYEWRNLNPFYVLDISHEAGPEDIARRYKALSLLLHPDKNRNSGLDAEMLQLAFDEVLKAKAKLQDEDKANHVKQLVEAGMKQGEEDHAVQGGDLKDLQDKAVQKVFATAEYNRRQMEERTRNQEKREREQEKEGMDKLKNERDFNVNWKQENRVEKRIGNWRDFAKKKKQKK